MRCEYRTGWRTNLGGWQESVSLRWRAWRRGLADQVGQTLAEYAMLLGGLAVAALLSAFLVFRDSIVDAFDGAADCVQSTCVEELGGDEGGGDDGDDDDDDDDDDDH